jgi:hypothetical protein
MTSSPRIGIPELAGLGTYETAARPGYSVDDTVRRLLRFQWLERRLMAVAAAHLIATPEWELKCGLALLVWYCAEHVEAIRQRIGEMRHPVPALDEPPDAALARFADELVRSNGSVELVGGIYRVAIHRLVQEYHRFLTTANLLVDHPSRRVIRFALLELEESLWFGQDAFRALLAREPGAAETADRWTAHLDLYLAAAGGVAGDEPLPSTELPPPRARGPFRPDLTPRRDGRFSGLLEFDFPPHVVYQDPAVPADERNLALLCKRILEMDVPEMMASVLVERTDLPWEFHRDWARQLWDETRHAMMGSVALEARGIDWTRIPLNIGFSLRLNRHATALERQTLLFAIEQSLMPGETGKRYEYRTAVESGDLLSAHFHDFDWADEVLHAQIGRRWLRREGISPEEALARAPAIHERTWEALAPYREPPSASDWWDDFVRRVLGRPSAIPADQRAELKILAE